MRRITSILVTLCACVVLVGCEREEPTIDIREISVEFGRGSIVIETATDTFHAGVEVAETEQQRRRGLMERTSLDPDSGMIFLFQQEQPAEGVFYMYNTLIPLSIAFIDADGRIGSIREMEPCTSDYPQWCPNYEAGVPFSAALEMNGGYFAERGIEVGDRVIFTPE